jgi:tripartite-type tricarboxylate transporter receptor subunit TctC
VSEGKVGRRDFLKYLSTGIGGLVVGGVLGYLTSSYTITTTPVTEVKTTITQTVKPARYFEGKTIELVVPYSAGGGYDLATRSLANYIPKYVKGATPVVINKPGAEALLGPAAVWSSKPDGLTVCLANAYANAYASLTKDYAQPFTIFDFLPLGRITYGTEVAVVAKDSPIKTVEDLNKLGRQVKFAGLGIGDESGISTILMCSLLKIPFVFVLGYKGSGEAISSLIRGDTDVYAVDEDTAYRYWQAGSVRPILTVAAQRIKQFGDVPALGELVTKEQLRLVELHDNIDKLGRLLIAHPKTPSEVYDAWQDLLKDIFVDADFIEEQEKIRSFKPALGDKMKQLIKEIKPSLSEFKEALKKVYPEL